MFVIVGSGYCLLRQARKPEVRESRKIRSDPAIAIDPRRWPEGSRLWERK